jgi:hypothetical protein
MLDAQALGIFVHSRGTAFVQVRGVFGESGEWLSTAPSPVTAHLAA